MGNGRAHPAKTLQQPTYPFQLQPAPHPGASSRALGSMPFQPCPVCRALPAGKFRPSVDNTFTVRFYNRVPRMSVLKCSPSAAAGPGRQEWLLDQACWSVGNHQAPSPEASIPSHPPHPLASAAQSHAQFPHSGPFPNLPHAPPPPQPPPFPAHPWLLQLRSICTVSGSGAPTQANRWRAQVYLCGTSPCTVLPSFTRVSQLCGSGTGTGPSPLPCMLQPTGAAGVGARGAGPGIWC